MAGSAVLLPLLLPLLLLLSHPARVAAGPPYPATDPTNPGAQLGPYKVSMETFDYGSGSKNGKMDRMTVWYPSDSNSTEAALTFPFISYAHGMFGGGAVEVCTHLFTRTLCFPTES